MADSGTVQAVKTIPQDKQTRKKKNIFGKYQKAG
jgi:hypothetical protein